MTAPIVLKGAHVIDPEQGIDRIADVLIVAGKIHSVGDIEPAADQQIIDVTGHYLTPGWIDLHIHAYGTLGFSNPDLVGVFQGVTSFVEAGGPGIGTLDEFVAVNSGLETSLYAGPYIRPMGPGRAEFRRRRRADAG